MIILNQTEVADLLPMPSCIAIMEDVLADLARGEAVQPLRVVVPLPHDHIFGLMPAHWERKRVAGAKLISVFQDNHDRGLPSHQGVVVLFDTTDGAPIAIVNGQQITAIRTAAVSAVGTRHLARDDAKVLAMIGTGEQARTHLEAIQCVASLERVSVWGPHRAHALRYQADMAKQFGIRIDVCDSVQEAVREADIICTVTSAKAPILHGDWVKPGAHVNAVGASRKTERELASDLVQRARFYADRVESARNESGDFLTPLQEGVIGESHLIGEIGDLLLGRIPGRQSDTEITVFKALGLAVEDIAAAQFVYQEALRLGKGTVSE